MNFELVTGYAPANGAELYFESAGAGPTVVFIHAGVSDRRMWDPQFEVFAKRFRVIRYDLRGFGKSTMPPGRYARREDLHAVLKYLGVNKAALVGCSMGGETAIDFTLEHPEAVSALVPVAAGISGWNDFSTESFNFWGQMMGLAQKGDVEGARELDARHWIDGPSRDASRIDRHYRTRARQLHEENFRLDRLAFPEDELNPPAIGRLGEIKAKTLVVIGDSDDQDLIKIAHRLSADIPAARLETIENAAHLPSLERPEKFNRLVLDFLTPLLK